MKQLRKNSKPKQFHRNLMSFLMCISMRRPSCAIFLLCGGSNNQLLRSKWDALKTTKLIWVHVI